MKFPLNPVQAAILRYLFRLGAVSESAAASLGQLEAAINRMRLHEDAAVVVSQLSGAGYVSFVPGTPRSKRPNANSRIWLAESGVEEASRIEREAARADELAYLRSTSRIAFGM